MTVLKAHLHPRVIAVVCFYFESLYSLNAWPDWLNALKHSRGFPRRLPAGDIAHCVAHCLLTMEDNFPRNFYNSIVEEGPIEEEEDEEVDVTAEVRLRTNTLILCEFSSYSVVFSRAMDSS